MIKDSKSMPAKESQKLKTILRDEEHDLYAFRQEMHSSYSTMGVQLNYTNFTGEPVFVKGQNNILISISPSLGHPSDYQAGAFQIEYSVCFKDGRSLIETYRQLKIDMESPFQVSPIARDLFKMMDTYIRQFAPNSVPRHTTFTTRRLIHKRDLMKEDVHYEKEMDVLVSFNRNIITLPHPNSSTGRGIKEDEFQKEGPNYGLFVKVVDNDDIAPYRYYYAGKEVVTIKSIRDPHKESGVYVTRYNYDRSKQEPVFERMILTFEEAKTVIGLFASIEEAQSNGRPDIILEMKKAENLAREADLKFRKQETEFKKADLDNKKLESEKMLSEYQSEKELNKINLEIKRDNNRFGFEEFKENIEKARYARSDFFEERGTRRKDTFDEKSTKRKDEFEDKSTKRKDNFEKKSSKRKDKYEEKSSKRKDFSESVKFIFGNWGTWVAIGGVLAGIFLGRKNPA
jgi:hypothetical protein